MAWDLSVVSRLPVVILVVWMVEGCGVANICGQEHKILQSDVGDASLKLLQPGWRVGIAPAALMDKGGTSAGTIKAPEDGACRRCSILGSFTFGSRRQGCSSLG